MSQVDEYELLEQQLEKKDDKVKDSEGAGKDKDRSSSRRSSHKHSSRDRERDGSRHKSSRRDSEKDRRRSRSRSTEKRRRSRDRRSDRRSDYSPRRDSDRSRRERRERTPPREPTPPEVREQRERERELLELDRDIRTIFAYNLPLKANEKDLFNFFSAAGKIVDVKIIMDRNTRRSKGFAYIEYANREDIVKAMSLTGQLLLGQAVMVKSSEAEKNLAWEAAQAQQAAMNQMNQLHNAEGPTKLLITNLHANITESDLKQIFEPFGPIEHVSIQKEGHGRPNNGYVTYKSALSANKAMQQLDNMDIAGMMIQVKIAPLSAGESAQLAAAAKVDLDDEDDGGGMKMNSSARAALMSRLAGGAAAGNAPLGAASMSNDPNLPPPPPQNQGPAMSAPAQALALEQGVLGPASPKPTQCVLLKNMFDPTEETQPDWDKEIAEDVKEECSKFGSVIHVHVDRMSQKVLKLFPDKKEEIEPIEAFSVILKNRAARFVESVEAHFRLKLDPKYPDQQLRATVQLPKGTGNELRVAVFCDDGQKEAALAAGADILGSDQLIESMQKGDVSMVDKLISTPTFLPKLAKLGKILGPRGLMPNPKSGTVTTDVSTAVKALKRGKIEYKIDRLGNVHVILGKTNFSAEDLFINLKAVQESIDRNRPSGAKGMIWKAIHICSSMGPSIPLSYAAIKNAKQATR